MIRKTKLKIAVTLFAVIGWLALSGSMAYALCGITHQCL